MNKSNLKQALTNTSSKLVADRRDGNKQRSFKTAIVGGPIGGRPGRPDYEDGLDDIFN